MLCDCQRRFGKASIPCRLSMHPRLPKGLIRICVLLWLVKALCQGLGWLFPKKLLAPSLHFDAASGIRESNPYQNHALGPTCECQRMKSGIIDNATYIVNRPSRYRYALPREGMATETEPAQGCNTMIGFTLVLPVIDARLRCLALPGAACNILTLECPRGTEPVRCGFRWLGPFSLQSHSATLGCIL